MFAERADNNNLLKSLRGHKDSSWVVELSKWKVYLTRIGELEEK